MEWYRERSERAAWRFLDEISRSIDRISEHPAQFARYESFNRTRSQALLQPRPGDAVGRGPSDRFPLCASGWTASRDSSNTDGSTAKCFKNTSSGLGATSSCRKLKCTRGICRRTLLIRPSQLTLTLQILSAQGKSDNEDPDEQRSQCLMGMAQAWKVPFETTRDSPSTSLPRAANRKRPASGTRLIMTTHSLRPLPPQGCHLFRRPPRAPRAPSQFAARPTPD